VLGTEGRLHFDSFNQADAVDFIPVHGHPERHEAKPGLFIHEFLEVNRCLDQGLVQSAVMPLSASLSTSRTLDAALRMVHGADLPEYLRA